jgi:hypothetical protein
MASNVVGTAYVRLRLLTDSIGKDIEKSVKKSDLQDLDIHVNADTGKAGLELDKLGAKSDELGRKSPTITPKVNSKDAQKQASLLKDALILLGPAVGPLGGAATAAFAGVAAGAGVAVLAVLGVKKQMQQGTDAGTQFRGGIQLLQKDLGALEATAAKAVLPGFKQTVTELNTLMPSVNQSVNILGKELGDISAHVVVGLVGGLKTFEPLLLHVGQAADIAARHFQEWATSTGGGSFANTLGSSFDKVIPVLASLAQAVGRLVAAFAPIGSQVVGIIGALSDTINAIPLPVLQALASTFVSLYAANKLAGVFGALSKSIEGMGASAALSGTRLGGLASSVAGFTRFAGAAAATGLAVYSLGKSISNFLESGNAAIKVMDNFTIANSNFFNALTQSKGIVDDTVKSTVQYQLSQDGLTKKAAKAGISQDQLTMAITGTDEQTKALIETWKRSGKPSGDTLFALELLHEGYQKSADAAAKYNAHLDALAKSPAWNALKTNSDSVQQVANKFHVSADAVQNYASLLGISSDAIKNGVVTNQQLANAVSTVSSAYNTASMAGSTFLDALQKFSTSAGTAADRAQLIGSYLKAAQGDLLGYSGAVASSYQANFALTQAFQSQGDKMAKLRDQIGKGKLDSVQLGIAQRNLQRDMSSTEFAAINLKTGIIDLSKQGAGPLIQQLQAMQDAAMGAAAATYQHERATSTAGRAASDAAKIFKTQTYDALVQDAAQLGLTTAQAQRLAQSYFALPKDVATKVRALGTDPVVTVLNKIGQQLAFLTGHPWVTKTNADTGTAQSKIATLQAKINSIRQNRVPGIDANSNAAKAQIAALQAQIDALHDKEVTIRVNQINKVIPVGAGANAPGRGYYGATGGMVGYSGIQRMAGGGMSGQVKGPGSGASDTAGLFALSNGEYVVNAASTKIFLSTLKTINSITSKSAAAKIVTVHDPKQTKKATRIKSSSRSLQMVQSSMPTYQHPGHTMDLAMYLAKMVASVSHLAVAFSDRPIQLVAKDGTGLAQIVNDANLKNARRTG